MGKSNKRVKTLTSLEDISCSQTKAHSQNGLTHFWVLGLSQDYSEACRHQKIGRALVGVGTEKLKVPERRLTRIHKQQPLGKTLCQGNGAS